MNPSVGTPAIANDRQKYRRALIISCLVALVLLTVAGALIAIKWPFTRRTIQKELAAATSGIIEMRGFRTTYFPPGCVIEGLEFRQSGDSNRPPLLTAAKLTIRANYRNLLRKRIEVLHLEDVWVDMGQKRPQARSSAFNEEVQSRASNSDSRGGSKANSTAIAEIIVDRAVIEFPRKEKPLQFHVHQVKFGSFVAGKPISFHLDLGTPLPPGRVAADGQFGPWDTADVASTPLSGVYRFTEARLHYFGGIAGTLSSQGTFAGPAKALHVQGATDTPNYEVVSIDHTVHLRTQFQALVNCTNGDVALQNISGEFEKTSFGIVGDVAGTAKNHSKVASLQVQDPGGRVEDWLRLLAPDPEPPMTGPITFHAHITIPGGRRPFIQRVRLSGDFVLTGTAFTKQETQRGASELSLRAQGQKVSNEKQSLPMVLGNLSGHVDLVEGVAHFSDLVYTLPGARARMFGTYSFSDERIDLHGELRVDTKFSATASGAGGLLTRVLEPLIARSRGKGEVLPVKLAGTYKHPSYGIDK